MNFLKSSFIAAVILLPSQVFAASASFVLDISNTPSVSGITVAEVTVYDNEPSDDFIYINIAMNTSDLTANPENNNFKNFGIDKFYFNSEPDSLDKNKITVVTATNSLNGDDNTSYWNNKAKFQTANNVSMFGIFDNELKASGKERITDLTLQIDASGDDIFDYILISDSTNVDAEYYFAAHIAGFDFGGVNSAFFSTSPKVVPVPAAVWFFGTALLGLLGYRRKMAKTAA